MLERLFTDPHPYVRADALRNRLATPADLIRAAHDSDVIVRAAAAISPKLSEEERRRLATTDRSSFVRDEAAQSVGASALYRADRGAPVDDGPKDLTDLQKLAHWPVKPSEPSTKWLKIFSNYHPGLDEIRTTSRGSGVTAGELIAIKHGSTGGLSVIPRSSTSRSCLDLTLRRRSTVRRGRCV